MGIGSFLYRVCEANISNFPAGKYIDFAEGENIDNTAHRAGFTPWAVGLFVKQQMKFLSLGFVQPQIIGRFIHIIGIFDGDFA